MRWNRRLLSADAGSNYFAQQPWHENLGKRQVKAPKIYFRDSGLFHALSPIKSESDLLTHPKIGAS